MKFIITSSAHNSTARRRCVEPVYENEDIPLYWQATVGWMQDERDATQYKTADVAYAVIGMSQSLLRADARVVSTNVAPRIHKAHNKHEDDHEA